MENPGIDLGAACLALEEIIEAQKERLDGASDEISSLGPSVKASRAEIIHGKTPAALEALKHNLAALQGFLDILGSNLNGTINLSRILEMSNVTCHFALFSLPARRWNRGH